MQFENHFRDKRSTIGQSPLCRLSQVRLTLNYDYSPFNLGSTSTLSIEYIWLKTLVQPVPWAQNKFDYKPWFNQYLEHRIYLIKNLGSTSTLSTENIWLKTFGSTSTLSTEYIWLKPWFNQYFEHRIYLIKNLGSTSILSTEYIWLKTLVQPVPWAQNIFD